MLNEICKYCKLKTCNGQEIVDGHCPEKLKNLLEILKDNFRCYECNVDYLLKRLSVSHDKLNYLTKKYFKCTPKNIIENLRLEHALMSVKGDSNIIDVAIDCGYNDTNTFRKAYKRRIRASFPFHKTILLKSTNKEFVIKKLIDELWS